MQKIEKMYLNSFSNLTIIHLLPVLDLQTNWMTVHQQRIFRTLKPAFETVLKLQANLITVYR